MAARPGPRRLSGWSPTPPEGERQERPRRPTVDRGGVGLRRRLRRRLRTRRLIAVGVASSAALVAHVHGVPSGTAGTGDPSLVTVAVATRDLRPGDEIEPGAVRAIAVPAVVAPGAGASDPVGRTVVAAIHAGEIVHPARLRADRLGLAVGEVAVALARPAAPLPLADGDIVELVGVAVTGQGVVRATPLGSARVLFVDDTSVTVAVGEGRAVALVEHRARGTVEILLTPARP